MALRYAALNIAPNTIIRTVNFKKFGQPSKINGVVTPGSWTYTATIEGQVISFKAPFATLTGHNGAKLQYRTAQLTDTNTGELTQIDWFDLYDTITDAADAAKKRDAIAAITAVGADW